MQQQDQRAKIKEKNDGWQSAHEILRMVKKNKLIFKQVIDFVKKASEIGAQGMRFATIEIKDLTQLMAMKLRALLQINLKKLLFAVIGGTVLIATFESSCRVVKASEDETEIYHGDESLKIYEERRRLAGSLEFCTAYVNSKGLELNAKGYREIQSPEALDWKGCKLKGVTNPKDFLSAGTIDIELTPSKLENEDTTYFAQLKLNYWLSPNLVYVLPRNSEDTVGPTPMEMKKFHTDSDGTPQIELTHIHKKTRYFKVFNWKKPAQWDSSQDLTLEFRNTKQANTVYTIIETLYPDVKTPQTAQSSQRRLQDANDESGHVTFIGLPNVFAIMLLVVLAIMSVFILFRE